MSGSRMNCAYVQAVQVLQQRLGARAVGVGQVEQVDQQLHVIDGHRRPEARGPALDRCPRRGAGGVAVRFGDKERERGQRHEVALVRAVGVGDDAGQRVVLQHGRVAPVVRPEVDTPALVVVVGVQVVPYDHAAPGAGLGDGADVGGADGRRDDFVASPAQVNDRQQLAPELAQVGGAVRVGPRLAVLGLRDAAAVLRRTKKEDRGARRWGGIG